jgi:hypothetical protein
MQDKTTQDDAMQGNAMPVCCASLQRGVGARVGQERVAEHTVQVQTSLVLQHVVAAGLAHIGGGLHDGSVGERGSRVIVIRGREGDHQQGTHIQTHTVTHTHSHTHSLTHLPVMMQALYGFPTLRHLR